MGNLGPFIWSIADQLRGPYKPHQYGDVILPMTILRRLDCLLADTHDEVLKITSTTDNPDLLQVKVRRATGLEFFNTSPWTLKTLLGDPDGLETNLIQYIAGFSANIDVFPRFKFEDQIHFMAESNLLYIVVEAFTKVDLHPSKVTNAEMGDMYEYLIRAFNESSNESPGEHFTPRDAIRLIVDLIFAGDDDALSEPGVIRSIYETFLPRRIQTRANYDLAA